MAMSIRNNAWPGVPALCALAIATPPLSGVMAQTPNIRDSAGVSIVSNDPPLRAGFALAGQPVFSACVAAARPDPGGRSPAIAALTTDGGILGSTTSGDWFGFDSSGHARALVDVPLFLPRVHPGWLASDGDTVAAYVRGRLWLLDREGHVYGTRDVNARVAPRTSYLDIAGVLSDGSFVLPLDAQIPSEPLESVVRHAVTLEHFAATGDSIGTFGQFWQGETFGFLPSHDASARLFVFYPTEQPLFAHVLFVRAAGGRVYVGDGVGFEVAIYSATGALEMIVRSRRTPRSSISAPDSVAWVSEHPDASEPELRLRLPSLPAFSRFEVGPDGRLWVEDSHTIGDAHEWVAFGSDGRELGRLAIPVGEQVLAFGADKVLVSDAGSACGVDLRVYRITSG